LKFCTCANSGAAQPSSPRAASFRCISMSNAIVS
jgi:hypothetical protein